jgi:tetratricopeptide (TPR) repeat protein
VSNQNVNPEAGQIKFLCEAGLLLESKGKFEEACEVFEGVIALSPKRSIGYTLLGDAWMSMGKYDDAIKIHQQAVDLEPDNTFARVHLGETHLMMKKKDKGLAELRKVLEADPNGADGTLAKHLIKASELGVFTKA